MKKLKAGIFSFTCCEGCQLQILDLWEKLLEVLKFLDIEFFRLAQEKNELKEMDIAIVEGGISTKEEQERLEEIRNKSRLLVAIGECACSGGIPAMRNTNRFLQPKGMLEKTTAVGQHVKVDYPLRGCPIDRGEFLHLIVNLATGKIPQEAGCPVCMECATREIDCLLLKGQPCMGPVTCGGCSALCPSVGSVCEGCRGILKDAGLRQFREKMKEIGISGRKAESMLNRFSSGDARKVGEMQKKNG